MTYLEECNKYFEPLDEISEAVRGKEGISGLTNRELIYLIDKNDELAMDLYEVYGVEYLDYI